MVSLPHRWWDGSLQGCCVWVCYILIAVDSGLVKLVRDIRSCSLIGLILRTCKTILHHSPFSAVQSVTDYDVTLQNKMSTNVCRYSQGWQLPLNPMSSVPVTQAEERAAADEAELPQRQWGDHGSACGVGGVTVERRPPASGEWAGGAERQHLGAGAEVSVMQCGRVCQKADSCYSLSLKPPNSPSILLEQETPPPSSREVNSKLPFLIPEKWISNCPSFRQLPCSPSINDLSKVPTHSEGVTGRCVWFRVTSVCCSLLNCVRILLVNQTMLNLLKTQEKQTTLQLSSFWSGFTKIQDILLKRS